MSVAVHRLAATDNAVHFAWSGGLPPALTVEPGDRVVVETRTGDDGQLAPGMGPDALDTFDFSRLHALTGPIAVRGARPGDWLAVHVEEIATGPWGFILQRPGAGVLRGFDPYLRFLDLEGVDAIRFGAGVTIPIRPFLGVMGVAPSGADVRTIEPGRHGGNIDCRELTAGSTLYLPIQVPDALFSCGDGHAAQGDGEVCVTAVECALTARLRFDLVQPRLQLADPIAETAEGWITIGAAPTVEEAAAAAVAAMVELLAATGSMTRADAYALCSAAVDVRINQLVNGGMCGVRAVLRRDVMALATGAVMGPAEGQSFLTPPPTMH
ncbi:MAG TPA: acetamidase/formamidase family protein [Candidatus Limnocylindrales bacterium]|nr:acetamidase/formamidase family protein [Candidatus Limnocylindrales bacterium]